MQPIPSTNIKVLPLSLLPPRLMWFSTLAVIRMFGIFALAQLHHGRFWDSLSQQLQKRGPGYIKRCNFRNKPLSIGGDIILPAVFPSLPYQSRDTLQVTPFVKVREEDLKEVSEMVSVFLIY